MRHRLDPAGKLYPPDNLQHAYDRVQALTVEITRIDNQLTSPHAGIQPNTIGWRIDATEKRDQFCSERAQTKAWIAEQHWLLFKDSIKILRTLHDEEVDFSDEEYLTLERGEEIIKLHEAATASAI
jgi:hypothetical protein